MELTNEQKLLRDADILYNSGCCLHTVTTQLLQHSSEYGSKLNYNDLFVYIRSRVHKHDLKEVSHGPMRSVADINSFFDPPPAPPPAPTGPVIPKQRTKAQIEEDKEKHKLNLKKFKEGEKERKRALENLLSSNFQLALQFLEDFKINCEHAQEPKGITRRLQYIFGPSREWRVQQSAIKFIHSKLDRNAFRDYILKNDLGYERSYSLTFEEPKQNFITELYLRMYSRTTHCHRCNKTLSHSIKGECHACNWIKCRCGACGCNYRRR
jgi:hypothetical protein